MFATWCTWIPWWVYTAGVGYVKAIAEDEQMRNMFGEEWKHYAMEVRCWYVPGLAWITRCWDGLLFPCFFFSRLYWGSAKREIYFGDTSLRSTVPWVLQIAYNNLIPSDLCGQLDSKRSDDQTVFLDTKHSIKFLAVGWSVLNVEMV